MEKLNNLYDENFNLLFQASSVINLVLDDLQKIELLDADSRKRIDRCLAVLSILPDKIKRLELVSDERHIFEQQKVIV